LKIPFNKYQGTGNDFVVIDNLSREFDLRKEQIVRICDRKFGVGSDGLILIQKHDNYDFEMVFYNPDASQSFCGNGSRCAVLFAKKLGLFGETTRFLSTDGEHEAELLPNNWVKLKMHDVNALEHINGDLFLNTGSPHYVKKEAFDDSFDIVSEARKIRYNERYSAEGVNVNYIKTVNDVLFIRTYERGVEDETLSCGTGVTAAALALNEFTGSQEGDFKQKVQSSGGRLEVHYTKSNRSFNNIYLLGPATFVYRGEIDL